MKPFSVLTAVAAPLPQPDIHDRSALSLDGPPYRHAQILVEAFEVVREAAYFAWIDDRL